MHKAGGPAMPPSGLSLPVAWFLLVKVQVTSLSLGNGLGWTGLSCLLPTDLRYPLPLDSCAR